ncbi:hypothetical protein KA405_01610 [Patescibacteria group bacterium]|nr:hypothetical protein [Patescibacteria group bacterium]
MQNEYQRQKNALIDQLKTKNIEEQEKIHNDITKLELKFIQEATTDKPFR